MRVWTTFQVARLGDDALLRGSNGLVWSADKIRHGCLWADEGVSIQDRQPENWLLTWSVPTGLGRKILDKEIQVTAGAPVCIAVGRPCREHPDQGGVVMTSGLWLDCLIYVSDEDPARATRMARLIQKSLGVRTCAPVFDTVSFAELRVDGSRWEWELDAQEVVLAFRNGRLVGRRAAGLFRPVHDVESVNETFYRVLADSRATHEEDLGEPVQVAEPTTSLNGGAA